MPPDTITHDKSNPFVSMWRALAHRNYRLFFVGQGISLIGTWMTRVATLWLVFRLAGQNEDSAILLGMVNFAGQLPSFLMGPIAGALVDRWNRHRLLVATQVLSLVQSALLAVVAFSGRADAVTIAQVFVLSIMQGLINAFDMPCRQSFMVEMIERREDLANAIALNSSLVNGARLVGPALAGWVIWLTNQEGWCFVVDAVSYLAVIASLLLMRLPATESRRSRGPVWRGMLEGARYAFGFSPIRSILLLLALISFMGMPYSVLLPIFAKHVFDGGAKEQGFLTAAAGVGALIGALHLAARKSVLGLGRLIVISSALFGLALIGFALSHIFWLSLLLMAFTGMGMMMQMASSNTILQTITEEDKRGRVMSFYSMAFMGAAPFGSLFAGLLADRIGAGPTVLVGGAACVLGSLLFAIELPGLRRIVRPMYVKMGILHEVAAGMEAATE